MGKLEQMGRELQAINIKIAEIKRTWKRNGMGSCSFCKEELDKLYAQKRELMDRMFQLAHELGINI